MIIIYKSYKSSMLASFLSFLSSCCLFFWVPCVILMIFDLASGNPVRYVVPAIVSVIFWFVLKKAAKAIAESAHMRKLENNYRYAKEYIESNPEAHEYCMENNEKYAEKYKENLGEANFNPSDYWPS